MNIHQDAMTKVLIADHESGSVDLLRSAIQALKFSSIECCDFDTILGIVDDGGIDVLIIDPDAISPSAWDLIQNIRRTEFDSMTNVAIFQTNPSDDVKVRADQLRCDVVLDKSTTSQEEITAHIKRLAAASHQFKHAATWSHFASNSGIFI